MPKLMNKAIISAGDVSINIPDLKVKTQNIFAWYQDANQSGANVTNYQTITGDTSLPTVVTPLIMNLISTKAKDTYDMYSAEYKRDANGNLVQNTNPTYKFTAPKAGTYKIKIFKGPKESQFSSSSSNALKTYIYIDHDNDNNVSRFTEQDDGSWANSYHAHKWELNSYAYHNMDVYLEAGTKFWVGFNTDVDTDYVTLEVYVDLIEIVQETA